MLDEARDRTLKVVQKTWRGFKSRLTSNINRYMEDPIYRIKNSNLLMIPPAIYPSITPHVWKHFVASSLNPEFQEYRKLQQARRATNNNPHHLGRKGCTNLKVEIVSLLLIMSI